MGESEKLAESPELRRYRSSQFFYEKEGDVSIAWVIPAVPLT